MSDEQSDESGGGWSAALGSEAGFPEQDRTGDIYQIIYTDEDTKQEVSVPVSTDEGRIKAAYEDWVRGNALREINNVEQTMGVEAAEQFRESFIQNPRAYTWEGRAVRKTLNDVPGTVHLLYLLMLRCSQRVTVEQARWLLVNHSQKVRPALDWAVGKINAYLKGGRIQAGANGSTAKRQQPPRGGSSTATVRKSESERTPVAEIPPQSLDS